jgi:hypothetical protein
MEHECSLQCSKGPTSRPHRGPAVDPQLFPFCLDKPTVAQLVKKFLLFMEPCSEAPAVCGRKQADTGCLDLTAACVREAVGNILLGNSFYCIPR